MRRLVERDGTMSAGGAEVRSGGVIRAPIEAAQARLTVAQTRILAIMAGGTVGTLARGGLTEAVPHRDGTWPWATFVVNLVGALLLGWLLTRLAERTAPSRYWRPLLGTGFCGALTTFSTFQVETIRLAKDGYPGTALAYAAASLAAGMAVAVAGSVLARRHRYG
jgi:fluoride exporter